MIGSLFSRIVDGDFKGISLPISEERPFPGSGSRPFSWQNCNTITREKARLLSASFGERLAKGQRRVGEGLAKGWRRVGEGLATAWRVSLHPLTLQFLKLVLRRAGL